MSRPLLKIVTSLMCVFLLCIGSTSRSPFMLYHFPAPEFNKIYPLSKAESENLRKSGVQEINIEAELTQTLADKHSKPNTDVSHRLLTLDALGRVTTTEDYYFEGKKKVLTSSELFRYASNYFSGRQYNSICYIHSNDSIAYDTLGRVVYALSCNRFFSRKGKLTGTDTNYCYVLHRSDKNHVALRSAYWNDTSEVIYLDNKNDIFQIKNGHSNDSVSVEETSSALKTKKYWYLSPVSKTYQIGMVQTFKHNLLLKESIFTTHTGEPTEGKETSFFYDDNGLLIKKSTRWPNHTTVYDYEGALLAREYSIDSQGFSKITYRYHYRR